MRSRREQRRRTCLVRQEPRLHLGDIVVTSVERAAEQAEAGRGGQTGDIRWSVGDELRLLVTHGTLHICGMDHAEPLEEAAMRTLEPTGLLGADGARGSPAVSRRAHRRGAEYHPRTALPPDEVTLASPPDGIRATSSCPGGSS